mmetsp:Transcript_42534/g.97488  ORF Transcript_42534/g.97488 Transcript_42534/m.97488 type:complete len:461 (-) Transcript_42534:61-1443(-)
MVMNPALKRQFEESLQVDEVLAKQKKVKSREIGVVQAYDKSKGFGFVIDADKEKLFVHQSQIVSPGFRMLLDGQKVSFVRGENRGKPWAEDVRNPDGTPITNEKEEEPAGLAKKRKLQMKEQWRNFFEIPQYELKGYGESMPSTIYNQDSFVLGETVQQLGKVFVLSHGCCAMHGPSSGGNECSRYIKEKLAKHVTKVFEEKEDTTAALQGAFEAVEQEFLERAKMKSITDGAEVTAALFVHALNSAGQPCVQLWLAQAGTSIVLACNSEGESVRLCDPHSTSKERTRLTQAGYEVNDSGVAEVAFAEVGQNRPSSIYTLPGMRLLGGRPFKTPKSPVQAKPEVKKAREWKCVAGEELFLVAVCSEVASVLQDQDIINAALDAWTSPEGLDGWESAAKAVVRTAQAQGPASDALACMVVQCWWQEKPLQRLLARRLDRIKAGGPANQAKPVEADGFDMFS